MTDLFLLSCKFLFIDLNLVNSAPNTIDGNIDGTPLLFSIGCCCDNEGMTCTDLRLFPRFLNLNYLGGDECSEILTTELLLFSIIPLVV